MYFLKLLVLAISFIAIGLAVASVTHWFFLSTTLGGYMLWLVPVAIAYVFYMILATDKPKEKLR